MIVTLVPLTVLILGAMTYLAVTRMTDAQRTAAYAEMRERTGQEAATFGAEQQSRLAVARTLAATMSAGRDVSRDAAVAGLGAVARQFPQSIGVWGTFERNAFDGRDSDFAGQPGSAKHGEFAQYWNRMSGKLTLDPIAAGNEDPTYLVGKTDPRPQVTEPLLYEGMLMSSFIAPITRAGRFAGIGGIDVVLDAVNKSIGDVHVLDSGYAFMVSHAGTFVAAPRKELIGKKTLSEFAADKRNDALARIATAIKAGRGGHVTTIDPFNGKKVEMFWAPVATGKWGMVLSVPTAEVLAQANRLRTLLLIAGLIGTLLMTAVVVFLATRLTRPLGVLVERLRTLNDVAVAGLKDGVRALAKGDLTVHASADIEPVEVKGRDEVARASSTLNELIGQTVQSVDAYNEAREQLGVLISEVSRSAGAVSASSRDMATTSEEAGRAVGEIAHAVSDVAQGAERQVVAVGSVRDATERLSEATDQSAARAQETRVAAEQARTLADRGAEAVAHATEAMSAVREASERASHAIGALDAKSEQISGIVDTITTIAEQTNLLALNAAIEAARAGDQGRGFAVVAEEVRKLAEESQGAASSIAGLIAEIQAETQRTVEVVESGAQRSIESTATVEEARATFTQISAAIAQMADRVAEIAAAVESISETSRGMTDEVRDVAAVAEETSAATEQVSASTEQTSASAQEIAATAQELARTAEELEHLVSRFTLEAVA
ncbi:MAG: methyl-accepting chemotaxis sensory transducer with Cache sensor [Conexibacter sp.]|nr:methyl-accepting chemotaxis sensory transducer with Cache sensor [Conexibacter sp.]